MGVERIGAANAPLAKIGRDFDDDVLNQFHAFKVAGTCLSVVSDSLMPVARISSKENAIIVSNLFPPNVWKKIFSYMRPLELFRLCVTAKGWGTIFDFKNLRNSHILLWTEVQRLAFYDLCVLDVPIYRNHLMKYIDAKDPLTAEEFKKIKANLSKTVVCNQLKIQTSGDLNVFVAVNRLPPQVGPDCIIMSDAFHVSLIELLLQNIPSTKELTLLRASFHHLNIIGDLKNQLANLDAQKEQLQLVNPAMSNIGEMLSIQNERNRIFSLIHQMTLRTYLSGQQTVRYELEKNSLPNLERVRLIASNCTLSDIMALIQIAPNLKEIYIENCVCLTDADLEHLSAFVKILFPNRD